MANREITITLNIIIKKYEREHNHHFQNRQMGI
jgi:hypothetical protein